MQPKFASVWIHKDPVNFKIIVLLVSAYNNIRFNEPDQNNTRDYNRLQSDCPHILRFNFLQGILFLLQIDSHSN